MRVIATIATPPQEASTRPDGGGFMSGGGWAKRPRADQIVGRARSARLGASHIAAPPRARGIRSGAGWPQPSTAWSKPQGRGSRPSSCCRGRSPKRRRPKNTCRSCSTNMWVTNAKLSVLSIITGGGKWIETSIAADPLYQHLLFTAEKNRPAERFLSTRKPRPN